MNHLLVCFSCFLAHFEGWRWNRRAKWERTAPNSAKETGKAQVHAWGKSPGTASPSAWSLESLSFCYFLPFLLLLSCRPGSVSPRSIRVAPAFPGVLNSLIVPYFSFSSPQTYFSPLLLCSEGFLYHPSLVMKRLLAIALWGALALLGVCYRGGVESQTREVALRQGRRPVLVCRMLTKLIEYHSWW